MITKAKLLNDELKKEGYKNLGWTNGWKSIMLDADGNVTDDYKLYRKHGGYSKDQHPEYNACRDAEHKTDECQHNQRGSENTISCDICKIYWKYDCSD